MRRLSSFILFCLVSAFVSLAMTLQDAKNLYRKGEYAKALPEFERQYKKNPRNASINHWLGVCLFYEGKYARAEKYLIYADKKEVRESAYYLARLYYIQYRGAEAIEYAEKLPNLFKTRETALVYILKDKNEKNSYFVRRLNPAVMMAQHIFFDKTLGIVAPAEQFRNEVKE